MRDGAFDMFRTNLLRVDRLLVVDREGDLAGLREDAVRDVVAAAGFIGKAETELVDVGRVLRTAGDIGFKVAVLRISVRMDLDPGHAFERRAVLHRFLDHFARRAGLVRGGRHADAVVLLHHCEVGAVAAGSENHALRGRELMLLAILVLCNHAGDAAVLAHDVDHLHVGEDARTRSLNLVGKRLDVGVIGRDRGDSVLGARELSARVERADPHVDILAGDVLPGHVGLVVEPLHGARGVSRHHENELRIGLAVAADEGLKRKEFRRIEDFLAARSLVVGVLLSHGILDRLDFRSRHLGVEILLDNRLERRRHRLELFGFRIDRRHVAFASCGVAADHGHLFENDDACALLHCRGGSNKTGAAGTHNDDVGLGREGSRSGILMRRLRLHRLRIGARLFERLRNRSLNGVGRDRCARNDVDVRGLGGDDDRGKRIGRERPDARSFSAFHNADGLNAVRGDVDFNGDFAVSARGGAGESAGRHRLRDACGKECERKEDEIAGGVHDAFLSSCSGSFFFRGRPNGLLAMDEMLKMSLESENAKISCSRHQFSKRHPCRNRHPSTPMRSNSSFRSWNPGRLPPRPTTSP